MILKGSQNLVLFFDEKVGRANDLQNCMGIIGILRNKIIQNRPMLAISQERHLECIIYTPLWIEKKFVSYTIIYIIKGGSPVS